VTVDDLPSDLHRAPGAWRVVAHETRTVTEALLFPSFFGTGVEVATVDCKVYRSSRRISA
jgi:hypothetical protein